MKETFGRRLARMRDEAGLSQPALAAAAGVHRQTIARLEGGSALPNGTTAAALARALGKSTDELLGTKTVDAKSAAVIDEFLASGEAAKMLPPPSEKEIAWLRENLEVLSGPRAVPRAVAFSLLSLRERPGWER